jgi:MoaA/NifB/PqqE/SkfB family radical SAM enzyme
MTSHLLQELKVLVLYPHSRCNCRCVMCDIWKTTEAQEISASEMERHLVDIERLKVKWVVFSGGEPLMHTDLFRLASMLHSRGIRSTLLSTGLLLQRHASDIVKHMDDLIVSLDGPPEIHDRIRRTPGAFTAMQLGLRELQEFQPEFPVSVRTTVQKQNHSVLRDTVSTARSLNVNRISFLAVDVASNAFNRASPLPVLKQNELTMGEYELPALESEIEAIIEDGDCGKFVAESPEKLRRIVHTFRARLGHVQPLAPACNAPWVSAVIESDGTVRPCFFQPPIGKLDGNTSLWDVLNSPFAVRFRETLTVESNPICQGCVCSLVFRG